MSRLIHAAFYKLLRTPSTWVLGGLCVLFAIVSGISYTYSGSSRFVAASLLLSSFSPAYFWPMIFAIAFIATFVYTEFKEGTFRNQVVSGFSRRGIFFSYWLVLMIFSLAMCLAYGIVSFLVGLPRLFVDGSFFSNDLTPQRFFMSYGLGVLLVLAWSTAAFTLIFMIKSPAWPIVIIVMIFVGSAIGSALITSLLADKLSIDDRFRLVALLPEAQFTMAYSGNPSMVSNFYTIINSASVTPTDFTSWNLGACLGEGAVVLVGFYLLGSEYFNKADMK